MGQTDVSGLANAAASIANAQNSTSSGVGMSQGTSWGSGQSSSWGSLNSASSSSGIAESWGLSNSQSQSEEYSRTYGREASAQDIQNAREANQVQRNLWQEQASYNAKQAEIDRAFQAEMSNTAYQRAVRDLLAAGLNPILAAGNMGASTPTGAMASSGLASAHKANAYAEQEGYGKSSSTSNSASYSYEKNKSKSKTKSSEGSQSSNASGSQESSMNASQSETTTQLKELSNIINDITKAGSAKSNTGNSKKKNDTKNSRTLKQKMGGLN